MMPLRHLDTEPTARTVDPFAPPHDRESALRRWCLTLADRLVAQRVPYIYGGSAPSRGFDCSGFIVWIWAEVGILAPGTDLRARDLQRLSGPLVPLDAARPGDLAFYETADSGAGVAGHVMMIAEPGSDGAPRVVGATGGGAHTLTVEAARAIGACVRYEPLRRHGGYLGAGRMRMP